MTELVAVTGATGAVGGRVARRLAARGVAQRLIVRDPGGAPELDGAKVRAAPGGYADGDGLRAALAGAGTLFLVPGREAPDRVEQHATAVRAAAAAGVRRIVSLSFLNAGPDATFTFARDHFHAEQAVRATGLAFTSLRMSLYMDFMPGLVGPDGVIRGPAGDGRVSAVLRDDVADAAAAAMARASGRPIAYVPETLEQAYRSRARYDAPRWEVDGWVTSCAAIAAGELEAVGDGVERLADHPPARLADWLAAHPDALAGAAPR